MTMKALTGRRTQKKRRAPKNEKQKWAKLGKNLKTEKKEHIRVFISFSEFLSSIYLNVSS